MEDKELETMFEALNARAGLAEETEEGLEAQSAEDEPEAEAVNPEEGPAEEEESGAEDEEEEEEEEEDGKAVTGEFAAPPAEEKEPEKKRVSRKRKLLAAVAALLILVTLGGFAVPAILKAKERKQNTVLTVNGREVLKDEFEYYVYDMIAYYGQYYGPSFFASDDAFQSLKEYICKYLNEHYVIYSWAEANGYKLTDEMIEENKALIAQVRSNYETGDDYAAALAANHLTEDLYLRLLNTDSVVNEFSTALNNGTSGLYFVSDDEARAAIETLGILGAKHILITFGTTDEEDAEKEALAFQIYERILAGEDFDALLKEYGEDPGMEEQPDGYTFGQGEMVQEFYDGTAALEVGQVGSPVVSDYGWHIILRVEPDLEEARLRALNDLINKGLDEQLAVADTVYNQELLDSMRYQDYIESVS